MMFILHSFLHALGLGLIVAVGSFLTSGSVVIGTGIAGVFSIGWFVLLVTRRA